MEHMSICSEIEMSRSLLAFYSRSTNTFQYHQDLVDYFDSSLSGRLLWDYLAQSGTLPQEETEQIRQICLHMDSSNSFFAKYFRPAGKALHTFIFICHGDTVTVALKDLTPDIAHTEQRMSDELTGLLTRPAYCARIEDCITHNRDRAYAVVFFDVMKFKAINELFGFEEGNRLLIHIADRLEQAGPGILCACRESADRFSFLADVTDTEPEQLIGPLLEQIAQYRLPFEISCNVGIYLATGEDDNGNRMLDKAILAQKSVKGNYARKINYFTDQLRSEMLSEQMIVGSMNSAIAEEQFAVYYQPQYNHSSGMLVGAEALVRWNHPERGLISPAVFIPIFEKNGFITQLDLHVFEEACRFLKRSQTLGHAMVPISVNFSVDDIYAPDFLEKLERIRQKYGVPSRYLRIEVTERVMLNDNSQAVNAVFHRLHQCGYIIELDDFGSGYSSLNVLKDLDVDIIKLDVLFLNNQNENNKGGTIISSLVNLAKWLKMPVIAEGVETTEQAEFLRSIGCNYVQGYLYSRPLPEAEYEKLISSSQLGVILPPMDLVETMNATNFWDPKSQETLIFNHFVGGAAILRYDRGTGATEILRVNQKYIRELGMNLSEWELIHQNHATFATGQDRTQYLENLNLAIDTMEEQECETWWQIQSPCCGSETICLRSSVRVIGSGNNGQFLFYKMIRNVTAEKQQHQGMLDAERRFQVASEQVNIYFWEYTIATREMRPCFRCMRDLGLPPLLRNYPDSAIERGIFPPEVADMYRDWHVQVANGVKELEAVIPLTENRVPFRVRYTTEFDENGNPIKAYGSAALVV